MRYFFLGFAAIVILVFLAYKVQAQPVAMVINQNSGQIIFHSEVCPERIGYLVEVVAKDGTKAHGCWRVSKQGLVVKWTSVEGEPVMFYPAEQVIVFKKGTDV
jgi:hypothetical protein